MAEAPDALDETLSRLSKKAGVKATIVLDRTTGSILKTTGQVLSLRGSQAQAASFAADASAVEEDKPKGAEDVAAMVWSFVKASGALVQELDGEDELKLLRLRTKKQELVIVPDPKWLLIVVHDTPPA